MVAMLPVLQLHLGQWPTTGLLRANIYACRSLSFDGTCHSLPVSVLIDASVASWAYRHHFKSASGYEFAERGISQKKNHSRKISCAAKWLFGASLPTPIVIWDMQEKNLTRNFSNAKLVPGALYVACLHNLAASLRRWGCVAHDDR